MKPENFKKIRHGLDRTVAALGEALEVDPRTVRRWESGERPIPGTAAIVMRLLAAGCIDIFLNTSTGRFDIFVEDDWLESIAKPFEEAL